MRVSAFLPTLLASAAALLSLRTYGSAAAGLIITGGRHRRTAESRMRIGGNVASSRRRARAPPPFPGADLASALASSSSSSAGSSDSADPDSGGGGGEGGAARRRSSPLDSYDVVIVGSGIGGLSCAAMLCHYGYTAAVFESHHSPGGAAHGFEVRRPDLGGAPFLFDTGPSFFSGLNPDIPAKASNPLRAVLDAVGEAVDCAPYGTFGLILPEGEFIHGTGFGGPGGVVEEVSGRDGTEQWGRLMDDMEPLADAVAAVPTAAIRTDLGAILTVGPFLPNFAKRGNPLDNLKLVRPFSSVVDGAGVTDEFVRNWLDLLCFCLSGLPADGTITAEMATMMGEFYDPGALMDCPVGGARSVVGALVRGIEKSGNGSVFLNSHVDEVLIDGGRAAGVRLRRGGRAIGASKAVVSNLSVWDTFGGDMVDVGAFPKKFVEERLATPPCKSFMHLHVGFEMGRDDMDGLQAHYMYMDDWDRGVDAEDNAVLVSIPSVHDTTLAPTGYGVLHAYTPATEDFARWENMDRKSGEYEDLKSERSEYIWRVLERIVPDIRSRAKIVRVGTPLTHRRFLRRHMGSYGPAIRAGDGSFPFPATPVGGLLLCGDSCFPGIGVPAVAGSGILAANSVSLDSLIPQMEMLKRIGS